MKIRTLFNPAKEMPCMRNFHAHKLLFAYADFIFMHRLCEEIRPRPWRRFRRALVMFLRFIYDFFLVQRLGLIR